MLVIWAGEKEAFVVPGGRWLYVCAVVSGVLCGGVEPSRPSLGLLVLVCADFCPLGTEEFGAGFGWRVCAGECSRVT